MKGSPWNFRNTLFASSNQGQQSEDVKESETHFFFFKLDEDEICRSDQ